MSCRGVFGIFLGTEWLLPGSLSAPAKAAQIETQSLVARSDDAQAMAPRCEKRLPITSNKIAPTMLPIMPAV